MVLGLLQRWERLWVERTGDSVRGDDIVPDLHSRLGRRHVRLHLGDRERLLGHQSGIAKLVLAERVGKDSFLQLLIAPLNDQLYRANGD